MKIKLSKKELDSIIEALNLASMYIEDTNGQKEEIEEYDILRNKLLNLAS